MFTSKITDTIAVPGEPGQTITIRKLSWRALEEARECKRRELFAMLRDMQGIDLPKAPAEPTPEQQQAALYAAYDAQTVLKHGIAGWTYSETPTLEEIDDQDEPWKEWAFRSIVDLSVRSAAEGEGSRSLSTPTSA